MDIQNSFYIMVHDFFVVYLPRQRKCSPHTIKAYRTALEQLLDYTKGSKNCKLSAITFEMLDAAAVMSFLDNLEENGCSVSTRNHKLKAIRAFFSYASMMDLSSVKYYKELEKVPWKKNNMSGRLDFLSEEAVKALLDTPDVSTPHGLRDRLLMILLYDTGARIQELLNLKICDIQFAKSPTVKLFGKGSKYRFVPIMPKTAAHIQNYMQVFHPQATLYEQSPLFYVQRNGEMRMMSDDNVRKLLRKYGRIAKEQCPQIPDNLHPHLFRHSRAMHLYQHGMDLALVSQWLGHANLETTLIYAHADTEMKRKAIEKTTSGIKEIPEAGRAKTFEYDDDTLKRLYGLR